MTILKQSLLIILLTVLCSCEIVGNYVVEHTPTIGKRADDLATRITPDFDSGLEKPLENKCLKKGNVALVPFAFIGDRLYFGARFTASLTIASLGLAAQLILVSSVFVEGTPYFVREAYGGNKNTIESPNGNRKVKRKGDFRSPRIPVPQSYNEGIPAKDYKERVEGYI